MYTTLPLKPINNFSNYYSDDNKHLYLIISKVEKPARRSKKTEDQYIAWEEQQETLKRLSTGHFNCYDSPISSDDIMNELKFILPDFSQYCVYKIKPTSSRQKSYTNDWLFYEFDIVKQFDTLSDFYKSLCADYLTTETIATLIDNFKYSNYIDKWDETISTFKEAIPDSNEHAYFSDIVKDFKNESNDCLRQSRDSMLLKLLADDTITVTSKYDRCYKDILNYAFSAGLYKSVYYYTVEKLKTAEIELAPESIRLLQTYADNPDVAELIKLLKPTFPGMKLVITKTEYIDDGYDSTESTEEVNVKDANEAKMYIARNFTVDFAELQRNIQDINIREGEDTEYSFELK